MKKSLGLYLHVPFCRQKCLYCDFCSFPRSDQDSLNSYVGALLADLEKWGGRCRDYTVDTVYLGGGTPTVLPAHLLSKILEGVGKWFSLSSTAEITAECNPATGSYWLFLAMRAAGYNRLSVGLQSAHEAELRALGRIHSLKDFYSTFEDARRAGFENLSADVMLGIPYQTEESFLQTLEALTALCPNHISAYGLSVEENTPFGRMGEKLILPDEDATTAMYERGVEYLAKRGWDRYEISNFAKAGYESRHNLKYWNCEPYLGLGPGAHSDLFGKRFGNSRDLDAYIEGRVILSEEQTPDLRERMNEYVMLQMRLAQGVLTKNFEERFGESFEEQFAPRFRSYAKEGFVNLSDKGVSFTPKGFYVSNAILSDVLDFPS